MATEISTMFKGLKSRIKSSVNSDKEGNGTADPNLDELDENDEGDELFRSIRGFMIFGRVLGVIPYKGVCSFSSSKLQFRWISIPSFISYAIFTILTLNAVLGILRSTTAEKRNAYRIAQSIRLTLYFIWGALIYLNFIIRCAPFFNMLHSWKSTVIAFTKPDLKLKRDVLLISTLILVSAILENITLDVAMFEEVGKIVRAAKGINKTTVLKYYYANHQQNWSKYFTFNGFLPVFIFIMGKFIMLAWNYTDVLIAIIGRALYFKFKVLYETAGVVLSQPQKEKPRFSNNPAPDKPPDRPGWIQLTKDHTALCELTQEVDKFLSPLLFCSYLINIYYICMQLVDGLMDVTGSSNSAYSVYRPWSFIHLSMRMYVISICCARINVYAHRVKDLIQKCPPECFSVEVDRLDRRVNGSREIGLSGLGCFVVTKPFILKVIGVVFTFEIVLLQVYPNAKY